MKKKGYAHEKCLKFEECGEYTLNVSGLCLGHRMHKCQHLGCTTMFLPSRWQKTCRKHGWSQTRRVQRTG